MSVRVINLNTNPCNADYINKPGAFTVAQFSSAQVIDS